MDNFTLEHLIGEISEELTGGSIADVQKRGETTFLILANRKRFLIRLEPQCPGLYLTDRTPDAPEKPNPFSSLLREYLRGSKVDTIEKVPLDRVVKINCLPTPSAPCSPSCQLIVELIPRVPNLVLVDSEGAILASFRHRTKGSRPLLPRGIYEAPKPAGKLNPFSISEAEYEELIAEGVRQKIPIAKLLASKLLGWSLILGSEVEHLIHQEHLIPWQAFQQVSERLKQEEPTPLLYLEPRAKSRDMPSPSPREVILVSMSLSGKSEWEVKRFSTMSQAVEEFYSILEEVRLLTRLRGSAESALKKETARTETLIAHLKDDLQRMEQSEQLQRYGELLVANLHRAQKEGDTVRLLNYYETQQPEITITINPRLSLYQNAQRFFRQASKAKRGRAIIPALLKEAEKRLAHLREYQKSLGSIGDLATLLPFYQQLEKEHIAPPLEKKKKPSTPLEARKRFRKYLSSDGLEILVGKSSRDNDFLTFKVASPEDFWLHVVGYAGSHVIVRNPDHRHKLPPASLREAAQIAGYYSKARHSSNVAVHYTRRKWVKKPKGLSSGKVLLKAYSSVVVTADLPLIKEIEE
ncbi:MAG: NFACT family protein [Acidobacteriota bacterium]